jgi:hypothetical protein
MKAGAHLGSCILLLLLHQLLVNLLLDGRDEAAPRALQASSSQDARTTWQSK